MTGAAPPHLPLSPRHVRGRRQQAHGGAASGALLPHRPFSGGRALPASGSGPDPRSGGERAAAQAHGLDGQGAPAQLPEPGEILPTLGT